ncbi:LytR/AlgR family response regulator transcription factor [Vagococcus fluvialis]|uniref:LytR/AlgR family response regulator transcription factor n=1 Tax=Vagococcus fluvialis TaxID=2738 RepID=UPI00378A6932
MKKLPVFICEDDTTQLSHLDRIIRNHIMINDMSLSLCLSSTDPYDIVAYFNRNEVSNGIYFLDIDLGTSIDGISLGQIIREKDPLGKIIFITTHDELAPLTLERKVEPLGYIIKDKDDIKKKVIECLDVSYKRYVNTLCSQRKIITFSIAKKIFNIDLDTVIFIEPSTTAHKLILYTDNGQYEFYGKINDYEKIHSELFRCHKAFLINPNKIEAVDFKKREIYFSHELSCFFSAVKRKKIESFFSKEG